MTSPQSSVPTSRTASPPRRTGTTVAAFLIGLPLSAGVFYLFIIGAWSQTWAAHYVRHPVERVEVIMFCCAVGALVAKLSGFILERRACRTAILPAWDGLVVPIAQAAKLLGTLNQLPRRFQNTLIVNRASAVLNFLCSRGSASELDDHLRTLADNDSMALEGSYALTRFITWAIPILGFLGTVLGITQSISGVTPEDLETNLNKVTDGLALAFDTTALALGLTMVTMFLSFLVERAEQSVLEAVDRYADRELAHRFERVATSGAEIVEIVRRQTDVMVQAVEQIVQRQTTLWAQALEHADRRRFEAEERHQQLLTAALEQAMERTLEAHAQRIDTLEKQAVDQSTALARQLAELASTVRDAGREQQSALVQVAQGIASQVDALARLQEGDKHLRRLQDTLNQNLATLAGAGTFEQAVQSLTAAIHLLTAKASNTGSGSTRLGPRSGAAA